VGDLPTPALVVDEGAFSRNLATMATVRPGPTMRPHVKAHKCTTLAGYQFDIGHRSFTCATPREVVGMAEAGVGTDLLLANETVDPRRLRTMSDIELATGIMVTVAVDSVATIEAASSNGIRSVLIDVNVGLPRCGASPESVGELTHRTLDAGLAVRGVMGYEGHLMALPDRVAKATKVRESMSILVQCADVVRDIAGDSADIVSAGGTGTFDLYPDDDALLTRVNEVQAGSYALMDTHYGALGLPFDQALFVLGTTISRSADWSVIDVGLKSLGMDHGNPSIAGAAVWFCSDEHTTFSIDTSESRGPCRAVPPLRALPVVGDRVFAVPAHVDPTVALHADMWLVDDVSLGADATILERWPVDLRGW
jgi:D-serine deaminase-like pyridoxal phosphate-dependent protein